MWQTTAGAALPSPHEVHVWRAELGLEPAALQRLHETLSADEQARAERFYAAIHRTRYTAGRGIMRAILSQYLGIPPGDLTFCTNAHGKPSLLPGTETEDLRFNLSHSEGLALFAFAVGRDVGVDLEHLRPFENDDRFAERFFAPQEVTALRALPVSAQAEAFFHCWTRKEAYIKGRGRGLSIKLSSFAVSLAPGQLSNLPVTSVDDPEAGRWSLRALDPGWGYVGAVAAEGEDWTPVLWQWS